MRQLHREFLRAGSDVMQAFTFYASDDKLQNRGNESHDKHSVSRGTDLDFTVQRLQQCSQQSL